MAILALTLCIITANLYTNIVAHATFPYKAYGVAFQRTKLPPNYYLNLAEAIKTKNFEQCAIQSEKSLFDAFNFHEWNCGFYKLPICIYRNHKNMSELQQSSRQTVIFHQIGEALHQRNASEILPANLASGKLSHMHKERLIMATVFDSLPVYIYRLLM